MPELVIQDPEGQVKGFPSRAPVFVKVKDSSVRYVLPQVARVQQKRLLRFLKLKPKDMVGTVLPLHIDNWSRYQAKVELMDHWAAERGGWLDEEGREPPFAKSYWTAAGLAGRAAERIGAELIRMGRKDARTALNDFIDGYAEELPPA